MLRSNPKRDNKKRTPLPKPPGRMGRPKEHSQNHRARGSQIREINIPKMEEEANPILPSQIPHITASVVAEIPGDYCISQLCQSPEPNDLAGLRPDSRTIGKSPETWSQESAEDLLLPISLEFWEDQKEKSPPLGRTLQNQTGVRSEIPKYIRVYHDYRGIIHIQSIALEEHSPHTVST